MRILSKLIISRREKEGMHSNIDFIYIYLFSLSAPGWVVAFQMYRLICGSLGQYSQASVHIVMQIENLLKFVVDVYFV